MPEPQLLSGSNELTRLKYVGWTPCLGVQSGKEYGAKAPSTKFGWKLAAFRYFLIHWHNSRQAPKVALDWPLLAARKSSTYTYWSDHKELCRIRWERCCAASRRSQTWWISVASLCLVWTRLLRHLVGSYATAPRALESWVWHATCVLPRFHVCEPRVLDDHTSQRNNH